jgi:hypothetical protein
MEQTTSQRTVAFQRPGPSPRAQSVRSRIGEVDLGLLLILAPQALIG